tara:strand:- start:779 stop:934 length:156 start_codon:yes stop_codon:yes gene_type:complete
MSDAAWQDKCIICEWIVSQRERQTDSVGRQALVDVEIDHVQKTHPERGFKK